MNEERAMDETPKHPYCCEAFSKKTNEFSEHWYDAALKQNKDGSWYVSNDGYYSALDNILFCPFCGAELDAPGLEKAFIDTPRGEKYFFHPDGSPVRWRDLASDGVYYINDDNTLEHSDKKSDGNGPIIRPRPDPRVGRIIRSADFGDWEIVEKPDYSVELKMVQPIRAEEDEDDGA